MTKILPKLQNNQKLVFMGILVILMFWRYFVHFLGYRGILVIFDILGGILVILEVSSFFVKRILGYFGNFSHFQGVF